MANNRLFRTNSSPLLFDNRLNISPAIELKKHLNPVPHFKIVSDKPVILIDWDGCLVDSTETILHRVGLVGAKLKEIW